MTSHNFLQQIFITGAGARRNRTLLSLAIIVAATLAITVPFAGQAFSVDGPLMLRFVQQQVQHPFSQALTDTDIGGIHYDQFQNTHPKFLPLYLSVVLRFTNGPSEIPVHLSMVVFPIIGAISMFYLGRRFRVSGLVVALLFLASPMLMVNAHMETVDVPGVSLWLAGITFFIYGVDKRSNWLLGLSTLFMFLTIQTFFQGLSILPLAIVYLVINRKFQLKNFLPVVINVFLFAAYLLAIFYSYGQLPRFSYRVSSTFNKPTFLPQLRGNLTVLGGTLLLPVVVLVGFIKKWTQALVFIAAAMTTIAWSVVKYESGAYKLSEMILFSTMLPLGITITYFMFEQLFAGLFNGEKRKSQEDRDYIWLALWFFGVLGYCVLHLSYPAPRFLLPGIPPVIVGLMIAWRGVSVSRWIRFSLVAGAIILTLGFSLILSVAYRGSAEIARQEAQRVNDEYVDAADKFWHTGGLAFPYYMQRNGYRILPNILNELYAETEKPLQIDNPQPGDYIVSSRKYASWMPYPSVMQRMRREKVFYFYNDQPISMDGMDGTQVWWAAAFLPFKINYGGEMYDEVTIWSVDETPLPLLEETKELYRRDGITWIE